MATAPTKPKSEAVGSDRVVADKSGVELTQSEYVQHVVNPTVEDKDGIERILGPALDNWQAAPVHATDEQKKANKALQVKMGLARDARLGNQEAGKAANVPGDGGSQSSTA